MSTPKDADFAESFQLIEPHLRRIPELIKLQLSDCPDTNQLKEIISKFYSSHGKMIRPALVLLSFKACSQRPNQTRIEPVLRLATLIEIIHNATILHDDVIDQAQKRRNIPTVNSTYGNQTAVLLGDYLLSCALKMCTKLPHKVTSIISDATAKTCQGEIIQNLNKDNWKIDKKNYFDIIARKSASLFESSARLGTYPPARQNLQQTFADYGHNLGMAFQITDDILDITGQENLAGKTLGRDLKKGKPTLPIIHLLENASDSGREKIIEKIKALKDNQSELFELLDQNQSLEYARQTARNYSQKAIDSISTLKTNESIQALTSLAHSVANRV